jgi:two-component system, NarL family, nitrate/nitrite response regulator NarL
MKKIKLLIVDDHQIILDGIASFLEKETEMSIVGFAHNGEQALTFLQSTPVDVVVLDIHMPVLDGVKTSKQIKKQYPNTKIILLTMEGDGQYILRAMQLGIHGYVVKEKSKEVLVQAIHSVAKGSSYWSPDLLPRIAEAQLLYPPDNGDVKLTMREVEIIRLMAEKPSLTAKEVAGELKMAAHTVNTHLRNARQKLKVGRTAELIKHILDQHSCNMPDKKLV